MLIFISIDSQAIGSATSATSASEDASADLGAARNAAVDNTSPSDPCSAIIVSQLITRLGKFKLAKCLMIDNNWYSCILYTQIL